MMPEEKQYPREFRCKNPRCGRLLGVISRDNQRIVSLYVLRVIRSKETKLEELILSRHDFAVLHMGYGKIPCTCGYDTPWDVNRHLMNKLIGRFNETQRTEL